MIAAADPAPSSPERQARDRMLVLAGAILTGATLVMTAGAAVRLAAVLQDHASGAHLLADCLSAAEYPARLAAFGTLTAAFLTDGGSRTRRLRLAAVLAAVSLGLGFTGTCIYIGIVLEGSYAGDYLAGEVFSGLTPLTLLLGAAAAATAFATDLAGRDRRLGWASVGLAAGYGFAAASAACFATVFVDFFAHGRFTNGFVVEAIGAAGAMLAGAIAALAFFGAARRSRGRESVSAASREHRLAIAAWVLAIAFTIVAVGEALSATGATEVGYRQIYAVAIWLMVAGRFGYVAAAVFAAAGLMRMRSGERSA